MTLSVFRFVSWLTLPADASSGLVRTLLAVTLSMTVVEFAQIQQLSVGDLRARFGLPASCEPAMTALSTDPGVNTVMVAIDCRPDPTAAPAPPKPPAQPSGRPPAR